MEVLQAVSGHRRRSQRCRSRVTQLGAVSSHVTSRPGPPGDACVLRYTAPLWPEPFSSWPPAAANGADSHLLPSLFILTSAHQSGKMVDLPQRHCSQEPAEDPSSFSVIPDHRRRPQTPTLGPPTHPRLHGAVGCPPPPHDTMPSAAQQRIGPRPGRTAFPSKAVPQRRNPARRVRHLRLGAP
ncbi:uncharacterized protein B0I36DRAFT_3746 [Microdochium trichocladiopsis]|uniref:Uncharacterized protein n=1 Tax=Microdochium trichocladiopsis TaxID=1682393 RepID=A0A9P9BVU8_9PEZI|nr:uncharacterized protein B0I36DRAFT_3746 [Microdochium trichocladiopsis]KAH7039945.1 hypothetical protein B0I36DRAFT_3746 [Microdochium trichocladiopsis]